MIKVFTLERLEIIDLQMRKKFHYFLFIDNSLITVYYKNR